jgi:CheY-like chemotaxis protein
MPGGGTLALQVSQGDGAEGSPAGPSGAGRYALLRVRDTGCGMSPEALEHLYEPFFTTKPRGKGTGLGLATVYGIVRRSGGQIAVASESGRGTAFSIWLPLAQGLPETAPAPKARPGRPGGSETVLVAEDDDDLRAVISAILRHDGYRVLEACGGPEALDVCGRHAGPIHLVVADVVMPQMSGPELGRRLAELRGEMKVLYVSGYAPEALVPHGLSPAERAFLQKPFGPAALLGKVRELLGQDPAR